MFMVVSSASQQDRESPPVAEPSERDVAIPYAGQTRARLLVTAGISRLVLRADAQAAALVRGHFTGLVPHVHASDDEVTIRYRFGFRDWLGSLFAREHTAATLFLHPAVAWDVVFRGGVSEIDADLRAGRLHSLEVSGGACHLDLSLPLPEGTVPVRFRGGASEITVRRPASVPISVEIHGGVSCLELDRKSIGAAGGELTLESDGWSSAVARYDVAITGGASDVRVAA